MEREREGEGEGEGQRDGEGDRGRGSVSGRGRGRGKEREEEIEREMAIKRIIDRPLLRHEKAPIVSQRGTCRVVKKPLSCGKKPPRVS